VCAPGAALMATATYATVLDLLGPDEQLLWSGEPDLEAVRRRLTSTRGRLPTVMILMIALALLAWLLNQRFGIVDWAGAIALHQRLPGSIGNYVVATVAVLLALAVVGPRLQLGRVALHQRQLARYAYALTDRRLLVVRSGRVTRELHPEDVGESFLHLHDDRTGDLTVRHLNATETNSPDGLVVFESVAEPAALQRRIDDWVARHLEHASRAVVDFVAGQRSGRPAAAATRRIVNSQFGIRIDVPRVWHVTVRHRRKPFGTAFAEVERWRDLTPGSNWNVVRAAGTMDTSLELHIDAGAPTLGYDDLLDSTLQSMFAGDVVESHTDLAIDALRGFSITRRRSVARHGQPGQGRTLLQQVTVLHDGRMQLVFLALWPDGCEPLAEAVALAMRSLVSTSRVDARHQPNLIRHPSRA
jgi:hypothetical protein